MTSPAIDKAVVEELRQQQRFLIALSLLQKLEPPLVRHPQDIEARAKAAVRQADALLAALAEKP